MPSPAQASRMHQAARLLVLPRALTVVQGIGLEAVPGNEQSVASDGGLEALPRLQRGAVGTLLLLAAELLRCKSVAGPDDADANVQWHGLEEAPGPR